MIAEAASVPKPNGYERWKLEASRIVNGFTLFDEENVSKHAEY
jgi:hypothetical protein